MRPLIAAVGCFLIIILVFYPQISLSETDKTQLRAKIGIQIKSRDRVRRAKNSDQIHPHDKLRIYVFPESDAFVYVIHSDHTTAVLLNGNQTGMKTSAAVLPSASDFYEVDGKSDKEMVTIIISAKDLSMSLPIVAAGTISHDKWQPIVEKLTQANKIEINRKIDKPIALAGNVRGIEEQKPDTFLKKLRAYSGKSAIIKTYDFSVKK